MPDTHVVLGISVPRCAQALTITPPVYKPAETDVLAVDYLEAYGRKHRKPEAEVRYECCLAKGLSDIVIILQRPYVKYYNTSFESIVQSSNTLRGVDDLIRFCTKGARSIYTTTVNAFPMEPDEEKHDLDAAYHELLAKILQLRKPKVILQCHRGIYKDVWMNRLYVGPTEYTFHSFEVAIDEDHTALAIQLIHPSVAVNNTDCHFLAAFRALSGEVALPDYGDEIRHLCLRKGQRRNKPNLKYWQAACYISDALGSHYEGVETSEPVEFADESPYQILQRRAGRVRAMYAMLRALLRNSCTPGSLAIAKMLTFFLENPFLQVRKKAVRGRADCICRKH